jgi:hypothetical protein
MSKTVFGAGNVFVYEREEDKMKVMQVSTKTGMIEIEFTQEQWVRFGVSAGWWKEYDCGGRAIEAAQAEAKRERAPEESARPVEGGDDAGRTEAVDR